MPAEHPNEAQGLFLRRSAMRLIGRMGRTRPTTKTLLICATTATFLNDSLREAFVIPYTMQFSYSVGKTVGCVQVAPRKRSRWAANMAFRGTMASVFGFTMGCEQTCRCAQSVVKTCGNLSKSKAEMRWAAKSSHLDAAIHWRHRPKRDRAIDGG